MVTGDSWELLRLARHWERGTLPFAGGLYDQPPILEQAVRVIRHQKDILAAQLADRTKQR